MKRNFVVLTVVAATVTLMLWAAIRHSRGGAGFAQGSVKERIAPDFALTDLRTNKLVHLSEFRGKVVLLNFWATWCKPCETEIPWLVELQKQYGPQGFVIAGIAMDDADRAEILDFADKRHVNYAILRGDNKVGDEYGVGGFPTSIYIDREGRIVSQMSGLVSHRDIEDKIKSTLKQRAAPVPTAAQSGTAQAQGVRQ